MARKKKNKQSHRKQEQRRQRKAARRKHRESQPPPRRQEGGERTESKQSLLRAVLGKPEGACDEFFVDRTGQVVADPWAVLGLPPGTHAPEAVLRAYREALLERPPESDQDHARALRAARDRLVDPDRWLEREVGTLWVPRTDAPAADPLEGRLPAAVRLTGEAVLYALAEDALWDEGLADLLADG